MTRSETLRRVLILSGSLGKGHDGIAEACQAALTPYSVECRIVDCMALLGSGPGKVGGWVFRRLLSVTALYDAFHLAQLRGGALSGRSMDGAAVSKMQRDLRREVDEFAPDLLVAVFPTGGGAAARLKADRPHLRSVVMMGDALAHRMWVHEGTDLFIVTSDATAESVRRYWPEAPVSVISGLVRPAFGAVPSQPEARRAVGVPVEAACVLLMSGAWGLGPLDRVASALAADGIWVLAVAGTSGATEAALRKAALRHPEIVPFGYTDRVPQLMAACDLVVTSSGDTCREARAVGRGLVLLDVVPGHGRENLMHQLELGGATVCHLEPGLLVRAVRSFLVDSRSKVAPTPG
ncbi:MAG: MGDG synthase family glycosyltransferase, partial [Acidimicrobiales bacterium]